MLTSSAVGCVLKSPLAVGQNADMAVTEKRQDLLVFKLQRAASICEECGVELHKGDLIRLQGDKGALCLECADMHHLEFLS
ncbi:MAG TPA: hypothetical protein VFB82_08150, partial [Blastocatellia bacterium]|nr:hypothetical protein [Blastocatellia bacterium]